MAVETITTPMSLTGSNMANILKDCDNKSINEVLKFTSLKMYQHSMDILDDYIVSQINIEHDKEIALMNKKKMGKMAVGSQEF